MKELKENSKTTEVKSCNKCGEEKPLNRFMKDKRNRSGYGGWCLDCFNAYVKTPQQRSRRRVQIKKWRQSKAGQENRKAENKKRREDHPEKTAANKAVRYAVQTGKLPKVNTLLCVCCNKQAHHYHHDSYKPEDKLNVRALCRSCHKDIHEAMT